MIGVRYFCDDFVGILLPFYIGHGFYREIGFEFQINTVPMNCIAVSVEMLWTALLKIHSGIILKY